MPLVSCSDGRLIEEAARAALVALDLPRRDDDPVIELGRNLDAEKVRQLLFALLPDLRAETSCGLPVKPN